MDTNAGSHGRVLSLLVSHALYQVLSVFFMGYGIWVHIFHCFTVPHDLELATSHLHFFFLLKTCIIKFGLGFFSFCMSIVNFDIFLNGEKKVRGFALLCVLNTDTIKASSFQSFPGLITCP